MTWNLVLFSRLLSLMIIGTTLLIFDIWFDIVAQTIVK